LQFLILSFFFFSLFFLLFLLFHSEKKTSHFLNYEKNLYKLVKFLLQQIFFYSSRITMGNRKKKNNNNSKKKKHESRPKKHLNCFFIFRRIIRDFLNKDFPDLTPQKRSGKAAEIWKLLSNEVKNSVKKYAEEERILTTFATAENNLIKKIRNEYIYLRSNRESNYDPFIFDDLSYNSKKRSLDKQLIEKNKYDELFDKYISC
jgi:hypothetical protein